MLIARFDVNPNKRRLLLLVVVPVTVSATAREEIASSALTVGSVTRNAGTLAALP